MDEIKVCAYCGTEYPATRQTCPLCGMNEAEAQKAREKRISVLRLHPQSDIPHLSLRAAAKRAAHGLQKNSAVQTGFPLG